MVSNERAQPFFQELPNLKIQRRARTRCNDRKQSESSTLVFEGRGYLVGVPSQVLKGRLQKSEDIVKDRECWSTSRTNGRDSKTQ